VSGIGGTQEWFLVEVGRKVAAINHATRDIPPEAMRPHLCWGNYEGPHTRDIPLRTIIGEVLKARPAAISFEGANPATSTSGTCSRTSSCLTARPSSLA
jgi:5-methyltetrahydropteroyltriglutamate--homocysteine methyltransferase